MKLEVEGSWSWMKWTHWVMSWLESRFWKFFLSLGIVSWVESKFWRLFESWIDLNQISRIYFESWVDLNKKMSRTHVCLNAVYTFIVPRLTDSLELALDYRSGITMQHGVESHHITISHSHWPNESNVRRSWQQSEYTLSITSITE